MTLARISTNKVVKISKQLSRDGIDIPAPSQAAICKSLFKVVVQLKKEIIENLLVEQLTLVVPTF